jgi:hypothetical protein
LQEFSRPKLVKRQLVLKVVRLHINRRQFFMKCVLEFLFISAVTTKLLFFHVDELEQKIKNKREKEMNDGAKKKKKKKILNA